jgi:hypothetical protein
VRKTPIDPTPKRGRGRPRKDTPPPGLANPFGGSTDTPGSTTQAPEGIRPPNLAADIMALPAEAVVPMVLHVAQGLIVRGAAKRYGEEIAKKEFALSKEERTALEEAGTAYMKSMNLERMTPGEMLAVTVVLIMGGKVVNAEAAKAALETRQPKTPPPPKPQPATKTA